MPARPAKPASMSWVAPYLVVRDADAAAAFYARAFGFAKRFSVPMPDGKSGHTEMVWHNAVIMFGPESGYGGTCKTPASLGAMSPVGLYVYHEDVDALYAQATAAGARADGPPQTMFYGDRVVKLTDPDGHLWYFATNVADFDPAKAPPPK
jgi:uncharacterized glyoxalase superfamily protein PhnB